MEKITIVKERIYIRKWFNKNQLFDDGDIIEFEMPSFCSGDYSAIIHFDENKEPYIDKKDDWYEGCRDYHIIQTK